MNKEKSKKLILGIFFLNLIIFLPLITSNMTEDECVLGGGEWIEKLGCDSREGEACPQYYCGCEQGYVLEENKCIKIPDKVLCESSSGRWENEICICPKNSVGWTKGFGCDYIDSVDVSVDKESMDGAESTEQTSEKRSSRNLIITAIIIAVIIIGATFLVKRQMKK